MVLVTRRPHARRPPQHSRRLSRDVPQFVSEPLSERIGSPVVVKAATTANPIGCFKGCGTWLAVANLAGEVGERQGVIVASAGNFGLGVAYACRALGVPAVVVMAATTANPAMVDAMRRLGAEVRLAGEDFDVARAAAAALALQTGQQLLVDGQDPWMAIGAGTIALELTDGIERDELPALSAIYVPVGNGSLIAGIGTWMRHAAPFTKVIGAQAARAPATTLSWRAGRAIETERADTVADGIAARVPVAEALELMSVLSLRRGQAGRRSGRPRHTLAPSALC